MLRVGQTLNQRLEQKLNLSQELLISLELIQLPVLDLKERIEKEVLENPILEIKEKYLIDKNYEKNSSRNLIPHSKIRTKKITSKNHGEDDEDAHRNFLENAISEKEGLHEKLIWQLNLSEIDEEAKEIGHIIISFIDNDGFFKEDLSQLFPDKLEKAKEVLELIQTFEPEGVASKDVREALLFQIESLPEDMIDKNAYRIVKDYFELMLERKDTKIAKELNITLDEVKKAFDFLSHFELYPGRAYDKSESEYIIPDVIIKKVDNELMISINDEIIPELMINSYYEKLVKNIEKRKRGKSEEEKYLLEKYNEGKKFVDFLKYRKDSLIRVVSAIVKYQKDFFYKGPKYLKPLTMKKIAEEVDLSESTVSRLCSSKYMQTEWGIHELKYFFTNSINNSELSAESVREMIKEIIEQNPDKHLSDQKIADILQNRGINIARRTVNKYRAILNILPSNKRNI